MRTLFVSAQLPGHLDWGGYLKTGIALQRSGQKVLWASGTPVEAQVTRTGIPFAPMTETGWRWPPPPPLPQTYDSSIESLNIDQRQQLRAERALDQWLDVGRVTAAVKELLVIAGDFAPDLLVAENFMSAGALVAERLSIPFVVAGWPALSVLTTADTQPIVDMGRGRLASLLNCFDLQGTNWTSDGPPALHSPHLHLTYWSPSWYQGIELLSQTKHVGGSAVPPNHQALDAVSHALLDNTQIAELPWVLVTLGTSFNDDANFFIAASHAVESVGAVPIMALGRTPPQSFLELLNAKAARSAILVPQLNFDQMLPYIGAAIHHGGAGTTHALVTQGIPQILVPHAADQMHQVHGVTRSQVGVGIRPQNVTIAGVAQMLETMLTESSQFQINAQETQSEFANLGGIPQAIDYLTQAI